MNFGETMLIVVIMMFLVFFVLFLLLLCIRGMSAVIARMSKPYKERKKSRSI